jgi:hypothetical protein
MPRATPQHLYDPQILKLTCDTYRHLSARRHNATLEYRATVWHVAYAACANTAIISALEDIQIYPKDSPEFKAAIVTMRQGNHTHNALKQTAREWISHIRHTKGGEETGDLNLGFAEVAYEHFLKPRPNVASSECDKAPPSLHRQDARLIPTRHRQSRRLSYLRTQDTRPGCPRSCDPGTP